MTFHDRAEPLSARALEMYYRTVRCRTEELCDPLSAEDCQAQSMEEASPVKWHLAHTSWFFETFVLEAAVPERQPFEPAFRVLFNSYYNSVGEQHARPMRGLLTRPSLRDVRRYREYVDDRILELLRRDTLSMSLLAVLELGIHHEQQHQELIVTDLKHLFWCNPLRPAYRSAAPRRGGQPSPLIWRSFEEGLRWIGHDGRGFGFDNESPRHRTFVGAFELASRPMTNGEFLEFVEDGGYLRADLWLSDGWFEAQRGGWRAPLYWEKNDRGWSVMTLSGMQPLPASDPVCHLSFYEADAFARWAGARLPTEVEWETAAADLALEGNFAESEILRPVPDPGSRVGLTQLFGDVWEWTSSPYTPYPGYVAAKGALGEYNGKFMCNQMVLRGGSCATPRSHIRGSYRNFFPPAARWQFSGLRLAR